MGSQKVRAQMGVPWPRQNTPKLKAPKAAAESYVCSTQLCYCSLYKGRLPSLSSPLPRTHRGFPTPPNSDHHGTRSLSPVVIDTDVDFA